MMTCVRKIVRIGVESKILPFPTENVRTMVSTVTSGLFEKSAIMETRKRGGKERLDGVVEAE